MFRGILADFPELPEPRNNLAVLHAQKGEYAQARDELERAVATAPDYAVAHENLGDVYARLAAVEYEKDVDAGQAQPHGGREAEADPRNAGQLGPFHPCVAHLYRAGRAAIRTTT